MMAAERARVRKEEAAVAAFNRLFPVGTVVRYWKGEKCGDPTGSGRTRSDAQMLSGHAVVWIEGCTGCVCLSHVEAVAKVGAA